MADKSIGDLNFAPGTVDDSNTLFVVQQSGAAYKLSGHEFIIAMETVLDGHGGINNITYTPPVAPSLTGTMVITLADQSTTSVSIQNGKGIATITDYWKASSSSSSVPSSWSTTRESMTSTNRYLWHYQHIVYNDNTYLDTTKTVVGVYGDTGDAWYVWIRYAGNCTGNPPYPASDSDIGIEPDNWIGIYSGTLSTAPTDRFQYAWFEIKGEKGDTGDSITSVTKTSTVGLVDTYTVYVGDPAVSVGTFEVTNGRDGEGSPSDTPPLMDTGSTGVAGVSLAFARGDHIHPSDTSRLAIDGTSASVWSSNTNNLNNFLSGVVLCSSSVVNAPYANWAFIVASGASGTVLQTAYALFNDFVPMQRHCAAGTWSAWQPIGLEKAGTITLSTSWSGSDPFYQTVTVSGATVTANSKVDLQPTETQLATLADAGVTALVIKNNNGTLTAYALGASLSSSMTIQCTVTEVIA